MSEQKVKLAFDLTSGDRSAVADIRSINDLAEKLSENFASLDHSSQRMVLHMEQAARTQMRGGPMSREENRNQERRVARLKEEADITRKLSQTKTDASTRERLERRASALEAAHGLFGGIGGAAAMTGGAGHGAGPGMLRRFMNWTPGARTFENNPMAMTLMGIHRPEGTVAERIGATVGGARAAIGGAITTGAGLIGLFEGLSLVSHAMGEYEQRAKGAMRVSSMLGVSFNSLVGTVKEPGKLDRLRSMWGFLSEEGLGAMMSMAGTMGISGTGNVYGAGLMARAYGLDIAATAGTFGAFERYTRGGAMRGRGMMAGRMGLGMEPDEVAAFKAGGTDPWGVGKLISDTAAGAASFMHGRGGEGPVSLGPHATAIVTASKAKREALDYKISYYEAKEARGEILSPLEEADRAGAIRDMGKLHPHGVAPEDARRDAAEKARMHSKITRGVATRSDTGAVLGGEPIYSDRYESVLAGAFRRSGLRSHLAGEFFESSAGVARSFAGMSGIANPWMVTGMLGAMGGAAWGGGAGVGYEPGRAADVLRAFGGGISGEGDSLAYAMKVRALGRLSGPVTVNTAYGPKTLDPKNPLHLKMIMENAMNEPSGAVLGAYMEEARGFGGLGARALRRMTGNAIDETTAMGFISGDFSMKDYWARKGTGPDAMAAARAAMETPGGELIKGGATIEKNLEDLGKGITMLRHQIEVAISTIAGAASGEGGGLVPALRAVTHAIKEFPVLMTTLAAGKLISGDVAGAAVIGGATGLAHLTE